jgi:hypothetical protein
MRSPSVDLSTLGDTFGGAEPQVSIRPGTMITTSTLDCFAGRIRSVDELPSQAFDVRYLNPQAGPFFVEGGPSPVRPSPCTWSIEPRYDGGCEHQRPRAAPAAGPDARDRGCRAGGRRGPLGAGAGGLGGNLDTPQMRAGTTCYLGVNVEGALFSFGDGHVRQREGETGGVAVVAAMDSVVIVDLIKSGSPTAWQGTASLRPGRVVGPSARAEGAGRGAHLYLEESVIGEYVGTMRQ